MKIIVCALFIFALFYLPANSQLIPSSIFLGTIYNNYSSYTIDIPGNSGFNHFSPDTITIYSQDTLYWRNNSNNTHCVSCNMFDTGNLNAGAVSQAITNFSVGTTLYRCKNHSSSATGVIIVLPSPASATRWEFFSREQSIQQHVSIPMPANPVDKVTQDSKLTFQFSGTVEIRSEYRHIR